MKPLSPDLPDKHLSRHDKRAVPAKTVSPTTDQHYRTTIEATGSVTSHKRQTTGLHPAALRSFRQLCTSIDDRESRRSYALETMVMGLVAALAAWPLISLLIVLAQIPRG